MPRGRLVASGPANATPTAATTSATLAIAIVHTRLNAFSFLLRELGAEGGELVGGDPDHRLEELLLADRALVRSRIDESGEVLSERADAVEVALRDHAAQLTQATRVLRGELARRDP